MYTPFILLPLVLLSACHVGNDYQEPHFITSQQLQENLKFKPPVENITISWYEIFKDSDLNTLIQHAMTENFSIQQGLERLQQSRLNLMIQSKQMLPMIDANGSYNYNKANNKTLYSYDINAFKAGIDASWEIDIWGKGDYISEQYSSLMDNVEYSLFDIKVSITAEVIANYINLREAQEKLNIALRNLYLQRDILQTVKDKHGAGIADSLALNQAEYTVETTKSTIPPLKTQIENYKNAIATLLGVLPSELPVNLDKYKKNITATTLKFDTKKLYQLPLNVIRSRPDIMAAEASIKAQNAAVNEAITSLYPSFNLTATLGFISSSGSSLFNTKNQSYGYTPGLQLPIWHWGQLVNNVELQKHIKEEYMLNYNEAMITAVTEIKNAITAIEQAYKTNTYAQNAFYKMRNIMDLTKNKYDNGLVEFTDVATAEQNFLTAQNALIASNAAILQYITAFYKATGGGFNLCN